eukprot:scaffold39084_cov200-Skeletonema_marinoi.AAC.1
MMRGCAIDAVPMNMNYYSMILPAAVQLRNMSAVSLEVVFGLGVLRRLRRLRLNISPLRPLDRGVAG